MPLRPALKTRSRIVKWNLNKGYLRDLEAKGVNIVPTLWKEKGIAKTDVGEWLGISTPDEVVVSNPPSARQPNSPTV